MQMKNWYRAQLTPERLVKVQNDLLETLLKQIKLATRRIWSNVKRITHQSAISRLIQSSLMREWYVFSPQFALSRFRQK